MAVVNWDTVRLHFGVMIPIYTLTLLSYFLRMLTVFWVRKARPSIEDILVTITIITGAVSPMIVAYADFKWALGASEEYMSHHVSEAARIFQLHQILSAFYCVNLWLLKSSVILLYHRIFVVRWFRHACVALIAFMSVYTVAFIIAGEAVCSKKEYIAYYSNLTSGTHLPNSESCKDYMIIWYVFTSTSMTTDFITVLLPMPLVRKLQTTRKRKVLLIVLFGVGLIPCLASIMRLVDLKGDLDRNMSHNTALLDLWTGVETSFGCLCANLPTLTPLGKKLFPRIFDDSFATPQKAAPPNFPGRTSMLQRAFGYVSAGRGRDRRLEERRWHAGSLPLDSTDSTNFEMATQSDEFRPRFKSIARITETEETEVTDDTEIESREVDVESGSVKSERTRNRKT